MGRESERGVAHDGRDWCVSFESIGDDRPDWARSFCVGPRGITRAEEGSYAEGEDLVYSLAAERKRP